MTRALHSATKVQRAQDAGAAAPEARQRGYEARDASAAKVVAVMAAFLALLLLGLAAGGLVLWWLGARQEAVPAPFADRAVAAPGPPLLADPVVERRRIERRTRVPDEAIARAMRQVETRGWRDEPPAAPGAAAAQDAAAAARAHREAIR